MAKKKTYYDALRQDLGALIDRLDVPPLYKQFLKQRWLDQVIWADKKSAESRRWHYRLRLTTIIGGVVLPALVGINFEFNKDNPWLRGWFPYVPFALSQVIAVSAAIEEFCRFGDRWRDYRKMSEDLKAEGWQYFQLSGAYAADKTHFSGYPAFANRVESIVKNDVQNYIVDLVKQQTQQAKTIEEQLESNQSLIKDKPLFQPIPSADVSGPANPAIAPANITSSDLPTLVPPTDLPNQTASSPLPASASPSNGSTAPIIAPVATRPSPPQLDSSLTPTAATTVTIGLVGMLRTRNNTVFKLRPQPADTLTDLQKVTVNQGSSFGLQAYKDGGNNHLYVTFNQGIGAEKRNSWYVYTPHVELLNPQGQEIQPTVNPFASNATNGGTVPTWLSAEQLMQITGTYAPRERIKKMISSINQTLEKYQINTPLRIAHFIAQIAHESDCFNAMEEYASGADYEGRTDLGNTQPGDGVRFKGRGLMQLTGRENYQKFSQAMGIDFTSQPEKVAQDPYAILVAGWYWHTRQINPVADRDDLQEVTRLVNGGYNGIEDRERYLQAAKQILGC